VVDRKQKPPTFVAYRRKIRRCASRRMGRTNPPRTLDSASSKAINLRLPERADSTISSAIRFRVGPVRFPAKHWRSHFSGRFDDHRKR
jgi:hypothetical protein